VKHPERELERRGDILEEFWYPCNGFEAVDFKYVQRAFKL
jgi:hypothetical protein